MITYTVISNKNNFMNYNLRTYDSIERIFREPMVWHLVEFFVVLEQNLLVILVEYG